MAQTSLALASFLPSFLKFPLVALLCPALFPASGAISTAWSPG